MKNLAVKRSMVWAAGIRDVPGGLAEMLSGLRDAGADLDFILARRSGDASEQAVVFVTPLKGDRQIRAAATLGFNPTNSVQSVRIEGDNEPGVAAAIAEKIAATGINLRGFSGAVVGAQFIIYIGLDSDADAEKVIALLKTE